MQIRYIHAFSERDVAFVGTDKVCVVVRRRNLSFALNSNVFFGGDHCAGCTSCVFQCHITSDLNTAILRDQRCPIGFAGNTSVDCDISLRAQTCTMQIRYIYVAIDSNMTIRNIYAVATACFAAAQRQTACRVDGQIDAIRIDYGVVMQPRDGGRARDGQRAGPLARGIAHFAVAEDVVLVGVGDLGAAHPHGVFGGSISRGNGDGIALGIAARPVGGFHGKGVITRRCRRSADLAVCAERQPCGETADTDERPCDRCITRSRKGLIIFCSNLAARQSVSCDGGGSGGVFIYFDFFC